MHHLEHRSAPQPPPRDKGEMKKRMMAQRQATINRLATGGKADVEYRAEAAERIQAHARGRQGRLSVVTLRLAKVQRVVGVLCQTLRVIRIKRMSELSMAAAHGKLHGVAFSVENEQELRKLRLWQQGDEEMHTREALEARYRNRSHPGVWHWLNEWWKAAMGEVVEQTASDPPLPKNAYVAVFVRVCKLLLDEDEEWDEIEATRIVEDAWEEDSHGLGHMTRSMFNDAVFELAECACRSLDPSRARPLPRTAHR